MLQETIGEAAGGGADIKANLAVYLDLPMFQRALQLESAAAYVFQIFAEQSNRRVRDHLRAGFIQFLIVNQDLPAIISA